MIEIVPCRFCKAKAIHAAYLPPSGVYTGHRYYCECGVCGPFRETIDEAASAWAEMMSPAPVPTALTLRDYFAGQVLAWFMASGKSVNPDILSAMAAGCYCWADALMAAREVKP